MSKRTPKQHQKPKGFTLIELLFAMTAFTVMLVVAVSGYLNAMWIYNQSAVSRDNQQQVRTIVDTIGRNIQNARATMVYGSTTVDTVLCLEGTPQGTLQYKVNASSHLISQAVSACPERAEDIVVSPGAAEQDLVGDTTVHVRSFKATKYQQPLLGAATTGVESVRITFGLVRGTVGAAATPRERQFSNQFELTSTFMLRDSGY